MPPYPRAIEAFPRLRQSILSDFDSCALAAKFGIEYDGLKGADDKPLLDGDGLPVTWSGHPQGRGTLFHRFARKAMEEMAKMDERRIEVDVALAILFEVLRQHDVPEHDVVTVPQAEQNDLLWIVKKWANDNAWPIPDLVDVEGRLEATLAYPDPDGGEVERVLTGQLDALFVAGEDMDEATVVDWKDTWALPGPRDVSFEGYFQQRFYAWLILKNHPTIQKVTLREFYVRYSEAREAVIWRADLEDVEQMLAALVERFDRTYENDSHKPSPGKHCSYCPRPTACPIFPEARGEGKIASEAQAEAVGARLIVSKAAYDQSFKALKAWAKVHGSTPVKDAKEPNRVFGFRESQRTERPKREVLEERLGEALTAEEIDALYPTKRGTRFESHVPKPEIEADDEIVRKLHLAAEEANQRKAA